MALELAISKGRQRQLLPSPLGTLALGVWTGRVPGAPDFSDFLFLRKLGWSPRVRWAHCRASLWSISSSFASCPVFIVGNVGLSKSGVTVFLCFLLPKGISNNRDQQDSKFAATKVAAMFAQDFPPPKTQKRIKAMATKFRLPPPSPPKFTKSVLCVLLYGKSRFTTIVFFLIVSIFCDIYRGWGGVLKLQARVRKFPRARPVYW